MADGALDSIANELKQEYPKGHWRTMINLEAPYRAMLRKSPYKASEGGKVRFPARLAAAWNVGIIADAEDMPPIQDPTRDQFEITPELFVGDFRIGIKTSVAATSDRSTFHEGGVYADRLEETAEYTAKLINKVYSGGNRTRLAIVESDGANNFVASQAIGTDVGVHLLSEGMPIEVRDSHTIGVGAIRDSLSNRRITAIDEDTRTVTYGGANQTLVAGDGVYIYNSFARTVWTLDDLVDDGTNVVTVQNLSRTTYPRLKANVLSNGGVLRNLSEQIILDMALRPRRRAGKRVTVFMSNEGQARKFAEFVVPDRRFLQSGEQDPKYNVGFGDDSLMITAPGVRAKLTINTDIKPRRVYALAWDVMFHHEAQELDWWDPGGGILQPSVGSNGYKSAVDAFIAAVENQGCLMPIACSVAKDLKDALSGDA